MKFDQVSLPNDRVFIREKDEKNLPKPQWGTLVNNVEGTRVRMTEHDPRVLDSLHRRGMGLEFPDLKK